MKIIGLTKDIIKVFVFWLLFFFLHRSLFLIFQTYHLSGFTFHDILLCNRHSMAMDISATSYILVLPTFLMIISLFTKTNLTKSVILYYYFAVIVFSSFINIADIGLFSEWGSKINRKALSFLAYPNEAFASTLSSPLFLLLSIFFLQSIAGIWVFKKLINHSFKFKLPLYQKIIVPVILLALLLTGIRGGLQTFPINKSWAYFSKHNTLNVAAVNSMWNFMELVFTKEEIIQNPYQYFPADEALKIVEQTHSSLIDTTTKILQNPRPNIIMIILESWRGDIIEPLGGENNVSPGFSELCKEGLLFTNFYSTGFRTEQCFAALISGFPSQPTTTIIRKFGKFDKLPSVVKILNSNGYNSSFYYGGELYFANTESYLEFAGFDKIIGENDFEFKRRTRWGAFDEELFDFCIQDMKNTQEPFFNIIMTTTSHEPFDAPVNEGFEGDDLPQLYRNTVHYTDRCLSQYITKAKEQAWYENTLFIIVSDHAHKYPLNRPHNHPERHRIPFLLYGDVLKEEFRGKENTRVSSHLDIPATILAQLEIKHETFFWSKNLFNKYKPAFAFYAFDEGFGWINERQTLVFDHKLNKVVMKKNNNITVEDNDTYLKQGKAYLQILLQEYIEFNN